MARVTFRTSIIIAAAMLSLTAPAGAQFYSEGYEFLQAVKNREGDEATEMLNRPGSVVVNSRDISSGETGLHITVARRDLTWTNFLLQQGANANIADNSGITPLMAAARLGWIEGVTALVEGGANVDVSDRTGETPLIAAVHSRNIDLITALIQSGADPDRADNAGRSARDYAQLPGTPPRVLTAIQRAESSGESTSGRTYGPTF